jgi:hypothetical protein
MRSAGAPRTSWTSQGPSSAQVDWDRLRALSLGRDTARSLALPLLYLAREGLPSAPDAFLSAVDARAGWSAAERRLLFALIDRYRIGAPPPWPFVSGRISNILWRRTLTRGSRIGRTLAAITEIVFARRKRGGPNAALGNAGGPSLARAEPRDGSREGAVERRLG